MKIRNNGGVLGPKNAGSPSYASGMWSIQELAQNQRDGLWPYASNPNADLNYGQTSLLLHGDGTNGGQNQTFLDSSTNNFTITRNGNATQGTFSPFSQPNGWWSNYFSSSNSNFTITNNANLNPGTGDFTIEAWIYFQGTGTSSSIFEGKANGLGFGFNSGKLAVAYSNVSFLLTDPATFTTNQWTHVAAVRSGTTLTLYKNGISVGSVTNSTNFVTNSTNYIGASGQAGASAYFDGYISNLRFVKGTAVYTSTFTPPTSPLTAITNTQLLICQSNRFVDNSTNAFTLTLAGTPSVQLFSPFSSSTPYVAATNGGSMYLDGSGDYLSIPNNTTFDITGSFTVELWYYQTASGTQYWFNRGGGAASWSTSNGVQYMILSDATYLYWQFNTSGGTTSIQTALPSLNAWHHVAIGYNGTTTRVWVDGVSVGTSTAAYTVPTTTNLTYIGNAVYTNGYFTGNISNFRFVKGTDVYGVGNSSITPPTTPLTAITNTSLLLNCQNASIIDSTGINDLETVGNAQISTGQSKFGGSSMYFDGSGSYLNFVNNPINVIGDFTIEGWFYSATATTAFQGILGFGGNASLNSLHAVAFFLGNASGGAGAASSVRLLCSTDGSTWAIDSTSSTGVTSNSTWYHFAVVRYAGTFTVYINGNAVITSTAIASTTSLYAGALNRVGAYCYNSYYFSGYLDDVRVTKGYARYLYSFTPPTLGYPNSGYSSYTPPTTDSYFGSTALLLHGDGSSGAQNNTFLDGSTNAFTITRNGNATQGTFSPFSRADGYWSNYFNGSSDYLTVSYNASTFGTGDFTVECWVYYSSRTDYNVIMDTRASNSQASPFVFGMTSTNGYLYYYNGTEYASNGIVPLNQWTHVAIARSSNTIKMFMNGNQVYSATDSSNLTGTSTGNITIGKAAPTAAGYITGYMSNLRIVKGTAVYTSNFTPSTTPLTAITNTSLLTCQSNRFKDNSTNAYALTVGAGAPSVQTFIPFEPTAPYSAVNNGGGMYFDGSGDYLTVPNNTAFDFGSGDFTIEMWLWPTTSSQLAVCARGLSTGFVGWIVSTTNFLATTDGATWNISISFTNTLTPNAWNHISIVRSGNVYTAYKNGATNGTTTVSGTIVAGTAATVIGSRSGQTDYSGYITDLRILKGTAVYTGAFTPPTAPLTAITNTQLLLSGTNAGIIDSTGTTDFETVSSAQVLSNQYKFGSGSMYFNGSSYLVSPASPNFILGTSDFTVEYWVYFNSLAQQQALASIGATGSYDSILGWMDFNGGPFVLFLSSNGTSWDIAYKIPIIPVASISLSQWFHVAITRYGSTFRTFCNGNQTSTFTSSASIYQAGNQVNISRTAGASYINAYVDDFRFTKGISRYNYNFTIPASAYPNN